MRVPLESGDRKIVIGAGMVFLLLMAAGILLSPQPEEPSQGYPSSYSVSSGGAKAAFLLLGDLGYRVERWENPPSELPNLPEKAVWIVAEPFIPPSSEDKWRIQRFIAKGGRVLATGWGGAALLPENDYFIGTSRSTEAKQFRARVPGPLSRRTPEIEMVGDARWSSKYTNHLGQFGDSEGSTAVSYVFGKGEVIWWADAEPLTNYGLMQASNLMLFLNSVGPPGERRILWDEYFHGQREGLGGYYSKTPMAWGLLQFLILAAFAIFSFGRRSGPLQTLVKAGSRLSPLEFVETLGDLYRRKRACAEALEIAYHRFRYLLQRRLGLPSTSTKEALWRGAQERLGCQDQDFFKLLQRCELNISGAGRTEVETLRTVQSLHEYAEQWRLVTRPTGE